MRIETKRLIIRDLQPEDAYSFADMATDGSLHDIGFDECCGDWIGEWFAEAREFAARNDPCRDYLAYTVTLQKDHTVIGSVGCSWYEDLREVGVTFFLGAQFRGKGYAAEAVRAYVRYFFSCYDTESLIATVRSENLPSRKVIERSGFQLTQERMYKDLNDAQARLYRFYRMSL